MQYNRNLQSCNGRLYNITHYCLFCYDGRNNIDITWSGSMQYNVDIQHRYYNSIQSRYMSDSIQ